MKEASAQVTSGGSSPTEVVRAPAPHPYVLALGVLSIQKVCVCLYVCVYVCMYVSARSVTTSLFSGQVLMCLLTVDPQ